MRYFNEILLKKYSLKHFNIAAIIILFFWLSFIPVPLQLEYHLFTKIFLAVAFLLIFINKKHAIFKSDDYPLWIFILTLSINVFFAQQTNIALKAYLDLSLPMFFIYYLMKDIQRESKFDFLARVISIISILISLWGVLESLFATNPLYEHFIYNPYYHRYITGFVRPMATQYHPPILGSYLLACIPFNFYLFKQDKVYPKILGITGLILNITVLILAASRGAYIGLITMIMCYFFMERKFRFIIIFSLIFILLILIFSYLPYPLSKFGAANLIMDKGGSGTAILSFYRLERFLMTLQMLSGHFFTGIGLEHFRLRFNEYYPYTYLIPYEYRIADNMYLTILAETGIMSFLAFLTFVFTLIKKNLEKLRQSYNEQKKLLILAPCLAFIGLLVNMGGYELFYWPNIYYFFCMIIGMVNYSGGYYKKN